MLSALKLGRTSVVVGSEKSRGKLGGRLDLLVKNVQGDNLFVVELKAEGQTLSDDDTKQAISYARLLDQIAPFVLVSNGVESKIFDSITKKELSADNIGEASDFWRNGRVLATPDDLRIRYEALKNFIGYSPENVRLFSRAQQAQRLKPLIGDASRRSKKYIPEIYTSRQKVRKAIDLFIQGDGLSFVLTGDSGVGKTNEMCALSDFLGENHITLFFSAIDLCKGLLESITDEFNWNFTDQLNEQELMRRLDGLAKAAKCKVFIVVDALDEAEVSLFEQSVSDFASRLGQFEGRVKLIASVKSTDWHRFESLRGNDSQLKLSLDTSWQTIESKEDQPTQEGKPFVLDPLTEEELDEVIAKYVEFFNLKEVPKGVLRDLCRSPFMMRVVSEVYEGQGSLPSDMSEELLISAWLDKKFDAMANPAQAKSDLIALAEALYNKLCEKQSKMMTMSEEAIVSEEQVRKSTSQPLNKELFSQGIIVRHKDSFGRESFSFYYGRVRDFIIARYLLGLDKMDDRQFREQASILLKNRTLQSALLWHLNFAPYSQRRTLVEHIEGQATLFLSTYQRILDELVPGLKPNLEPHSRGDVGLAYHWANGWASFGFYPVENGQSKITNLSYLSSRDECEREARRLGVSNWRGGGVNFGNADPDAAAAEFALERIVEAVDNGWLVETSSDAIVKESVFAIASAHQSELDLNGDSRQRTLELPLDIEWLDRRMQAFFGKRYYHDKWIQEQIDSNSKHVTSSSVDSNGHASYQLTIDRDAFREFSEKAESEANQGKRFPITFHHGERHLEMLVEYVERLKESCSQIDSADLPNAVDLLRQHYDAECPFSPIEVKSLLEVLFREGLIAYRQLVASNFSGLFDSQKLMQTSAVVLYAPPKPDDHGWEITYGFINKRKDGEDARIYLQPEEAALASEGRRDIIMAGNEELKPNSLHYTGLLSLLSPHDAAGFRNASSGFFRSSSFAHERAPIRSRAYEWIKADVSKLTANDLLKKLSGFALN